MKKTNILEPLGLDKKTENVYRALLFLADATANDIAKRADIKRTSVYHVLEGLMYMGIVSSYTSRGTKRFFAENPKKLKLFFEQKLILAERIIPELQKEAHETRGDLQVRIYEGRKALKTISEEALEAENKYVLSVGSSKKLVEFLGGKFGYGERRRKRGIVARSLRFPGDDPVTNRKLQDIRYLPKEFEFPGFIIIYDQNVGVILYESVGRGFVIKSRAFSKMAQNIFEMLWHSVR